MAPKRSHSSPNKLVLKKTSENKCFQTQHQKHSLFEARLKKGLVSNEMQHTICVSARNRETIFFRTKSGILGMGSYGGQAPHEMRMGGFGGVWGDGNFPQGNAGGCPGRTQSTPARSNTLCEHIYIYIYICIYICIYIYIYICVFVGVVPLPVSLYLCVVLFNEVLVMYCLFSTDLSFCPWLFHMCMMLMRMLHGDFNMLFMLLDIC